MSDAELVSRGSHDPSPSDDAGKGLCLECEGVKVSLGRHPILRGVDLQVPQGTVMGVLGPSGAGKSSLFRALVGELPCDAGRVCFFGRDVTHVPLHRRARLGVGYVPQTPSVLWDLSVADNLVTFARLSGRTDFDPQQHAAKLGLARRLSVKARELSGGERRRLEFLRALVARPRLLICDEPLAGLDPTGVKEVGRIFEELRQAGGAVIVADHRVGEVLPFCDRALLLSDGSVRLTAPAAEFADHPAVRQRYLT